MPLSLPEAIRALFAFFLLIAPGWLLVDPLFRPSRPRGLAGAAVGLGLGIGAFGLFLRLGGWLKVPLTLWIAVWLGIGMAGAVVAFIRWRMGRVRKPAGPDVPPWPDLSGGAGRGLVAVCLLGALLAVPLRVAISGGADNWDYLSRATMMLRADRFDAGNPYSPGLHDPYDPTFYGLIASVGRLSGVALPKALRALPILATPMEIGVVAFVAAVAIGSSGAGVAAAVVYAFLYGPFYLYGSSVHHQAFGDCLFLLSLAAFFLYTRQGRVRHLVLGAAAAAAGTVFHHFILVETALTIGLAGLVLTVAALRRAGGWRRPVLFTAVVAAALLPSVATLLSTHLEGVDPKAMDRFFRETYAPLRNFGSLYIPDPVNWYLRGSWHTLPALPLLFYFGRRLTRDSRAAIFGVLLVTPIFLVLNPLLFPLLAEATGLQVATRILNLTTFPSVILFGWVLAEGMSRRWIEPAAATGAVVESESGATGASAESPGAATTAPPAASRRLALVCAGLSALLVLPQELIGLQGNASPVAQRRELADSPVSWAPALERLRHDARAGQTVLSDPVTSYSIPTFAPLYVVATSRSDFVFQTPDYADRLRATREVLDPLAPPDSTRMALSAFNVDWILVNLRFTNPLTVEKLDAMAAGGVRRRFEEDGLAVYSVDRDGGTSGLPAAGEMLDHMLIPPAVFGTLLEPGAGVTFDRASGVGAIIGPEKAAPLDSLYITFYYEWRDTPPTGNLTAKLLREEAYGSMKHRVLRQLRGSILGYADVVLFPRELHYLPFRLRRLEPGRVFADQFVLEVSPNLVPGRYALYVRPGAFPTENAMGIRLGTVEIVKREGPKSRRAPTG